MEKLNQQEVRITQMALLDPQHLKVGEKLTRLRLCPNPNIEIWTGGRYYCKNRFGCLSASVHQLWLVELQDLRRQMSWMSWKASSGDCVVVSSFTNKFDMKKLN